MKNNNKKIKPTYISLFSSAGVGCFGFKTQDFECIATSELLPKRLNIQKINKKCKYDSGYICGDITKEDIKNKILSEIDKWKANDGLDKVDVLMATPPCQGMSTANYKKGDETCRNSLVVEAIAMVEKIQPRIFLFENVKAFLSTFCLDTDKKFKTIDDCINSHLSCKYNIYSKVVNFKEYGIPSSRPRTLVIGTLKSEKNFSPLNIFPLKKVPKTLFQAIGDLKPLKFGEKTKDLYHSFRIYPKYMEKWICDLKEGESAFNNPVNKPFKIVNGKKQILKGAFMGNKFCRMIWNKPAPCITTRNDQLASQTTIHPKDNRVLSIRELMRVMSIPDEFKWVSKETQKSVDKAETLIRQSIGEAVPTGIIIQIADNISEMLEYDRYVKSYESHNFIQNKKTNNFFINSFNYELTLTSKKDDGSFYTPQSVVYNTIKKFFTKKEEISILEPSCGAGAFIPQMLRLIDNCKTVHMSLVDINPNTIKFLKQNIKLLKLPLKIKTDFICDDFLSIKFNKKYDVILTNPPFKKINSSCTKQYTKKHLNNLYLLFLNKFIELKPEWILCVLPKSFIMTPESNVVRYDFEKLYNPLNIFDYGTKYFYKVYVEILSICFWCGISKTIMIENPQFDIYRTINKDYMIQKNVWLLYRDKWFDNYIKTLKLDVFDYYRDRQLTNKFLKNSGKFWVIRSRNLLDDGSFKHIVGYDKFINSIDKFHVSKFLNKKAIIFPNFTYNTRASLLPDNCVVNGSFCILIPKNKSIRVNTKLYSSANFRKYYSIIKNLSKFTINLDNNSIYYIGVKNEK